jgi:hypothetical protein
MNKGSGSTPIIPHVMGRKLLGGASTALSLAAGAVRHVVWYVSHQVGGSPREDRRENESAEERR